MEAVSLKLQTTIISTIKNWLKDIASIIKIRGNYLLLKRKLRIDLPEITYEKLTLNEVLNVNELKSADFWKGALVTFKPIISIHKYSSEFAVFGDFEHEYVNLINCLT